MPKKPIDELIDQQKEWLDPLGRSVVDALKQVKQRGGKNARMAMDVAHGVWLGHPLHPALTDVPVGAWTAAAMFDAIDVVAPNKTTRQCADAAIGIGALAALPAAWSGLADWQYTVGHMRRLGAVHGLLNVSSLSLYLVSLPLRRGKTRPVGVGMSLLGYGIAALSAFLGGELVFGHGLGVDRTAMEDKPPRRFVPVMPEAEVQDNKLYKVNVGGAPVLVVRHHGRLHALAHTCSHLGGPLSKGSLEDETVVCPWHGTQFDLEEGTLITGPGTFPQPTYEVRVQDGQIEVRLPG
jgi:nitrite reductase/ring-hydroxylating ferredoxin subunit/uncharacterized membrane protein